MIRMRASVRSYFPCPPRVAAVNLSKPSVGYSRAGPRHSASSADQQPFTPTLSPTLTMALRRNPSRSAKRAEPQPERWVELWEPSTKHPNSMVDRRLRALNLEAYPADVFGWVDDLVILSAFSSKGKKRRHHAVLPERSMGSNKALPPAELGKKAARICKPIFSENEASWGAVCVVASLLEEGIPEFYPETPESRDCLLQ